MSALRRGYRAPAAVADANRAAALFSFAVGVLTMHPFVSGRPARAAALERLIERAQAIDWLWIAAGDEIAARVDELDVPSISHGCPPGI
jgi:peptidoglycan/xylan/chitin deacetylase (PgdA/CDA1 family)